MPITNLFYLRRSPQTENDIVYYERIKALLEIGVSGKVPRQDCLVDSGAVLPVFPERCWKMFQNEIDWLYRPGQPNVLPDWITTVTGLGAQPVQCGVGKVKIQILEVLLQSRPPKSHSTC